VLFIVRRDWRYQRSNQNPYIEEEQTIQWMVCYTILGNWNINKKISPFQEWLSSQHSGLNIWFSQNVARRVSLVEQELLTLPKHLSSPPVFCGVHVTRSLVLYVCFVDLCLSFCTISFCHCIVCSSSIYGFWLLLVYQLTMFVFRKYKIALTTIN
jgi:hypothetical protein